VTRGKLAAEPETSGSGFRRAARVFPNLFLCFIFRPKGAKAMQRLLLFPVPRPETLVAGVTIFVVVGMALYGATVARPRVSTASTTEMSRRWLPSSAAVRALCN